MSQSLISLIPNISTITALIALIVVLIFFAYQIREKYHEKKLRLLNGDKAKLDFLSGWLNLNLSNITAKHAYELADKKLNQRHTITKWTIVAGVFLFVVSIIAFLITYTPSEKTENGCERALTEANSLVNRSLYQQTVEVLTNAFDDCNSKKPTAATIIAHAYRGLSEFTNALAWHKRALGLHESLGSSDSDLALSHSRIAYAYEGLEDWEKALEHHHNALEFAKPGSSTHANAQFSEARINLILWIRDANQKLLDSAYSVFRQVVNSQNSQKQMAYYYLSCTQAGRQEYADAEKNLRNSIQALLNLPHLAKYETQRRYMKNLIVKPEDWRYEPTFPMPCPAFDALYEACACKGDIHSMARKLIE